MTFKRLHFFFQCYFCGGWQYSTWRIKKRKCMYCNRTFIFDKCRRYKLRINPTEAPQIIKKLKIDNKILINNIK